MTLVIIHRVKKRNASARRKCHSVHLSRRGEVAVAVIILYLYQPASLPWARAAEPARRSGTSLQAFKYLHVGRAHARRDREKLAGTSTNPVPGSCRLDKQAPCRRRKRIETDLSASQGRDPYLVAPTQRTRSTHQVTITSTTRAGPTLLVWHLPAAAHRPPCAPAGPALRERRPPQREKEVESDK
jgi:hypothetical protein